MIYPRLILNGCIEHIRVLECICELAFLRKSTSRRPAFRALSHYWSTNAHPDTSDHRGKGSLCLSPGSIAWDAPGYDLAAPDGFARDGFSYLLPQWSKHLLSSGEARTFWADRASRPIDGHLRWGDRCIQYPGLSGLLVSPLYC